MRLALFNFVFFCYFFFELFSGEKPIQSTSMSAAKLRLVAPGCLSEVFDRSWLAFCLRCFRSSIDHGSSRLTVYLVNLLRLPRYVSASPPILVLHVLGVVMTSLVSEWSDRAKFLIRFLSIRRWIHFAVRGNRAVSTSPPGWECVRKWNKIIINA